MHLSIEAKSRIPALLLAAIQGDSDALGELILLHRGPIRAVVIAIMSNNRHHHPAGVNGYFDDYMQDIYLAAVRAFPSFDPVVMAHRSRLVTDSSSKFTGWIIRVAQFAMKDKIQLADHRLLPPDPLIFLYEEDPLDRSDPLAAAAWILDQQEADRPLVGFDVHKLPRSRWRKKKTLGPGRGGHRTPERAAEIQAHREEFLAQAGG